VRSNDKSPMTAERASWERPSDRPLVCGYRGAAAHLEGNTLESFARAFADGADAVECDVRVTSDAELFCWHHRSAPHGEGPVEQLTAADRRRHGICALDELRALRDREAPQAGLLLDVKSVAAGRALLGAWAPDERHMIESFSDRIVSDAIELGWGACLIAGHDDPFVLRDLLPEGGHASVQPAQLGRLSDDELARAMVGVVDDPALALDLSARGVWAINTSDPKALRDALG
jgi:hypothetical protein